MSKGKYIQAIELAQNYKDSVELGEINAKLGEQISLVCKNLIYQYPYYREININDAIEVVSFFIKRKINVRVKHHSLKENVPDYKYSDLTMAVKNVLHEICDKNFEKYRFRYLTHRRNKSLEILLDD